MKEARALRLSEGREKSVKDELDSSKGTEGKAMAGRREREDFGAPEFRIVCDRYCVKIHLGNVGDRTPAKSQ